MRRSIFFLSVLSIACWLPRNATCRPLVTEEVSTLGKYTFEAAIGVSQRDDKFKDPSTRYRTVQLPVRLGLGLLKNLDVGLHLDQFTQSIKGSDGINLSGSQNGLLSPEIKFAPAERLSFKYIWHKSHSEKDGEELPIARGNDSEFVALTSIPLRWPVSLNVGYLIRDPYKSQFGVPGTPHLTVRPGNIFEAKGAVEIPLRHFFSLVGEAAYYKFEANKVGGTTVQNSGGEAMDAFVGLGWTYAGWTINGAVGFGLLEERYTSFDLERGAGDVKYMGSLSYRLAPKRPS